MMTPRGSTAVTGLEERAALSACSVKAEAVFRPCTAADTKGGGLHDRADQGLQPADPGQWGVDAPPDLRTAAALIGASIERCA
nr:hypothetical protein [Streptomyces sp. S1D4-11]QIY92941.1 hypothetical protein HEP87_55870 [Streptomyces sp. S1D4-11]